MRTMTPRFSADSARRAATSDSQAPHARRRVRRAAASREASRAASGCRCRAAHVAWRPLVAGLAPVVPRRLAPRLSSVRTKHTHRLASPRPREWHRPWAPTMRQVDQLNVLRRACDVVAAEGLLPSMSLPITFAVSSAVALDTGAPPALLAGYVPREPRRLHWWRSGRPLPPEEAPPLECAHSQCRSRGTGRQYIARRVCFARATGHGRAGVWTRTVGGGPRCLGARAPVGLYSA